MLHVERKAGEEVRRVCISLVQQLRRVGGVGTVCALMQPNFSGSRKRVSYPDPTRLQRMDYIVHRLSYIACSDVWGVWVRANTTHVNYTPGAARSSRSL